MEYSLFNNIPKIIGKLSIFLFIIAGNFVGDIYSCGLRHLFNEYIYLKHIIGLFIMLFFVGLLQESASMIMRVVQSIFLYIWFIFIMRAPMIVTLISIIIISLIYLIDLYIDDLKKKQEKQESTEESNKKLNFWNKISTILFIISFIISILGTSYLIFIYKTEYRNNFSILKFILGSRDQECFTKELYTRFSNNPLLYDIKVHNQKKIISKKNNFIPKKIQKRIIR